MDLNNSIIIEKAAEILSDLKFDEEELNTIFYALTEITKADPQIQLQLSSLIDDSNEKAKTNANFTDLIQLFGDSPKLELIKKLFSMLINNSKIMETIQQMTIEKFYNKSENEVSD